jgi:hypothetical protein
VPSRDKYHDGAMALASGGLGAFLGFFCKAYRHHDFMLGQRNCQRFLQNSFALSQKNAIFHHTWSAQAKINYPSLKDDTHYPLIPLVGPAAVEEPLPIWPTRIYTYSGKVPSLIKKRVNRIIDDVSNRIVSRAKANSMQKKIESTLLRGYSYPIRWKARQKINAKIEAYVTKAIYDLNHRH